MRRLASLSLLAFLPGLAVCQTKPAFDVSDIHLTPRGEWVKSPVYPMQGGYLAGDRYELHRATMLDLIRTAYDVDAASVYGGPSWLDYDRYEVIARTKPGTRLETLRLMLQVLLADRFHLSVKPDTRQVPGYLLSKGKIEPKLKAASDGPSGGCQSQISMGEAGVRAQILQCRHVTMAEFAQTIRGRLSPGPNKLPVMDSTGLEGAWDFDLEITTGGTDSATSLIGAVISLGLKIEKGTVPQPGLVVDSVSRQPSANPPGVVESLPAPPPPVFEVASLKPCNDNHSASPRFEASGRVTATCMPLATLIQNAWNLPLYIEPVGLPKSMDNQSLSIVAKAPPGVAPDPQHNNAARDLLNLMVRSLLIERFQMKVHYEDRPADAYTLVAVKPKLAKADPAGRTGCVRQSQQNQGRALLVRLVCHNITMAEFAEQLDGLDTQFRYPVLNETTLEGAWDFTLDYDGMASLNARFPQFAGRGAASDGLASEPTGSITLDDAISKQLGLKLEIRKRPEPVLVIDHIAEKPIEN
jgi:uncharacterized protein (TIGR03435 family)